MFQSFKILRGKPTRKEPDFREKIAASDNDELLLILRRRSHYNPEASDFAVAEAIRRGLIASEQDLMAEDYWEEELSFQLFPPIKSPKIRGKLRRSIARSLVIAGIIPLVFGFAEINSGNGFEGRLIIGFGILWIYFAAQLNRAYDREFVVALLAANFLAALYVVRRLLLGNIAVAFDYFVLGIVFILVLYGLLFIDRMFAESRHIDRRGR